MSVRTARQAGREQGATGQVLAEFVLMIPIIFVLFAGIVEVALAFNATVGVNRASQNGAHLAAIMGNQLGADCLILRDIESDIYAPNDRTKIKEITIERRNRSGNAVLGQQMYTRNEPASPAPPLTCTLPDTTQITLPYTQTQFGYPEDQRCNVLRGPRPLPDGSYGPACPAPGFTPERTTVDNVAVSIRYRHLWATPLNSLFSFFAGGDVGWTIVQRNIFRVEPVE